MIHIIKHNDGITGRVMLLGEEPDILNEYRLLTRVLCDKYGPDSLMWCMAGLAKDDISSIIIQEHIKEA